MNQIPFDPQIVTWIITGGGFLSALIVIWKVGNQIQDKLSRFDERIKQLEQNSFLVGWRNYQIAAANKVIDPFDRLKRWEDGRNMGDTKPEGESK